jgi:hypothetical protein
MNRTDLIRQALRASEGFREYHRMKTYPELFDELGKPENAGKAFAVTVKDLELKYDNDPMRFLEMHSADYDHAVFFDNITGNVLVMRPSSEGGYGNWNNTYQRLR